MKRISDRIKNWYPNTKKRIRILSPIPRWRSAIAALAAVLIFGGISQIPPAQAAQFRTDTTKVGFELKPYPEGPITLCIKGFTEIEVIVSKQEQVVLFGNERPVYSIISGVHVSGSVENPTIGTLRPATSSTSFEDGDYDAAGFTFVAKKAGKTAITFKATVGSYWVGDGAPEKNTKQIAVPDKKVQVIVVQNCQYAVTISSHFKVPGLEYVGTILNAELTPDENGNYTGTAPLTWRGWWQVVPPGVGAGLTCNTTLTAPPQHAELTGKINDQGILTVEVTYTPATGSWRAVCTDGKQSTPPIDSPVNLSMTPLKISVPASTGGASVKTQDLVDQISAGSATYNIRPKKG